MITREKENRSLGNHHYGTTEREYWNFHGKLLFKLLQIHILHGQSSGNSLFLSPGDPSAKHTPIKGNKCIIREKE